MMRFTLVPICCLLMTAMASAQEAAEVMPGNRWLVLLCGLPGDQGHRERLTSACEKIIAAAEPVLGAAPGRVRVLTGDEEMQTALADKANGICTKESMTQLMLDLSQAIPNNDACWVIVLGHAHLYDNQSQFNIVDKDIDQTDFAAIMKPLACAEQVYWITTPVSGFWIKPHHGHRSRLGVHRH
jgi:hypothetical protein